jgi:hypothetical protein
METCVKCKKTYTILLVKWKILMLETLFIIIKKCIPHPKHDQQYVHLVGEGKTQVGWVVLIRRIVRKCVKVNNVSPKRSPCHVPYLDEMLMKYLC